MVEVVRKEEKERHVFEFEIEVAKDRVDAVLEDVYRDFNRSISVPGFRRGLVPKAVLRARLGKEAFLDELVRRLVPKAAQEVLEREGIRVVSEPDVEVLSVEEGEPLRFRLTVVENPEVVLASPENLEVRKYRLKVREDDIDAYIEQLRHRFGEWKESEGPVAVGDIVTVTLKDKHFTVQAGASGTPLAQEILGMRRGETKRILVGEGKEEEVVVRTVYRKHLPEVDEEFVKKFGEGFPSVAAFREHVRQILEEQAREMVEERFRLEAMVALCRASQVVIPTPLLDEETRGVIALFEKRLKEEGNFSLDRYLELTGQDFATFEEKMRQVARWRLRKHFVLAKYADTYGIEVTEEEIRRLVEGIAEKTGKPFEEVAQRLSRERTLFALTNRILSSKLLDDLAKRVKVREIEEPLNFDQWRALEDPEEEMIQG
ncbi:trigger factor [Candidatus Caldatribacterium sp.]|uniref:trigger factor n=1 Tax=Candidatus Caldatribacterium sp. TaxID=2282143 RepID=UPI0029924E3C|nr:trigger factor [Candidatus Caldatribacterium sp.]MDW8080432.1 trigger factor [Candidatus Calescibacterium sp.]